METLILIAVIGAMNILCFMVGAKVGQMTAKGESIDIPSVNPLEAIREHRENKEAEIERSKVETILRNIDTYDGTSYGQEDVG